MYDLKFNNHTQESLKEIIKKGIMKPGKKGPQKLTHYIVQDWPWLFIVIRATPQIFNWLFISIHLQADKNTHWEILGSEKVTFLRLTMIRGKKNMISDDWLWTIHQLHCLPTPLLIALLETLKVARIHFSEHLQYFLQLKDTHILFSTSTTHG